MKRSSKRRSKESASCRQRATRFSKKSRLAGFTCRSRADSKATFPFSFGSVRSLPETKQSRPIYYDALCAMSIHQSRSFRYEHLPSILIRTSISGWFARVRPCSRFLGGLPSVWPSLVSTEVKLIRSRDELVRSESAWRLVQSRLQSCD